MVAGGEDDVVKAPIIELRMACKRLEHPLSPILSPWRRATSTDDASMVPTRLFNLYLIQMTSKRRDGSQVPQGKDAEHGIFGQFVCSQARVSPPLAYAYIPSISFESGTHKSG